MLPAKALEDYEQLPDEARKQVGDRGENIVMKNILIYIGRHC